MRRAGRAARERRGRGASLGGAAGLGEVREEEGAGTVEETRPAEGGKPLSPAQMTSSPAPSPSPAPADATPSSPSPASVEPEPEPESESDAETSAPATSARPSRTLTLQGHRMLAEAAERRMAAERAARARAVGTATPSPPVAAAVEASRATEGQGEAEAPQRSEVYERLFPVRPGLLGTSSASTARQTSAPTTTTGLSESPTAAPSPPSKSRPPPPPPPPSRPSSAGNSLEQSTDPSSAAPSPGPSTEPARTPSVRRPPPPPPPGASAILAARRASLRSTQSTPPAPPASTAEPARRRPLPVPPAPLAEDRLDAFTALRMARGELPASPRLSSSGDGYATPRPAPSPAPVEPTPADVVEHPGPPLPRRPPRAAPAAAVVSNAQEQPAALAEVPEFSMYTDLDLLLARLEAQESGSPAEGARDGSVTEPAQGGENYDDFLLLSDVLGQAVPAGASPAELESLTVARVECERRRVTKGGKVKSKLSVVGVRCVDCAVSRRLLYPLINVPPQARRADRRGRYNGDRSASPASKSTSSPSSCPNASTSSTRTASAAGSASAVSAPFAAPKSSRPARLQPSTYSSDAAFTSHNDRYPFHASNLAPARNTYSLFASQPRTLSLLLSRNACT
ncbi:hypothetical protein AAT19DRAFT_12181 [Rhodotorula toruloides]|uniref:Uncharacterized protein n=1 Tax=Rhodotorula toruloides TaxID=5286 RepID=A0A2T0AFJ3_RHOTO|nr:hypothetical protein AAT19DRAFT_12181 [Rhodotorula toruloides]